MLKRNQILLFSLGIKGLLLLGAVESYVAQAMSYCPPTSFGYALNMLKKGSLDSFIKMSQHHLKNLKYQEVEALRHIFEDYRSAFNVARELYQNKELQNIVNKMQAEVAAMPAQLTPEPGAGFRPNISIYIEREEKKLIDEFNIRHGQEIYWISGDPFSDISLARRALDILRQTTMNLWEYVPHIQAKINKMSDQQVDRYFVLEEAKLDQIDWILQRMEDEWEVTLIYDSRRGLYRRDMKKKISAQRWTNDKPLRNDQNAIYEELKAAVCEKMGKDFADDFNQKYPHATVEAVKELAHYIDDVYACYKTIQPKKIIVRIGSRDIWIKSSESADGNDIVAIIMSEHQNI